MVSGINDLKTLILFEIGIMLALALTIILCCDAYIVIKPLQVFR